MENSSSSSSSSSSSPNSSSSSSNSSSNNGVEVGVGVGVGASPPALTPKSSPIPPVHSSNPYPTTFVQADTQSFKQMVQLLTGSAETAAAKRQSAPKNPIPPLNRSSTKKPAFKLYERRPSMKNLKMISPFDLSGPTMNRTSPSSAVARSPLSPSILDFPSLALSPVTPLIPDPFDRCSPNPNPNPNPNPDAAAAAAAAAAEEEEERAIAEKGFYLHPSPRPDAEPPRLLPLFPVTSPRGSSA